MKVTMFAAPFGQGGQMHIHCRRYIRLLQLTGCEITLVEHSGALSRPLPGVELRKYPRRMRRLDALVPVLSLLHKRRLEPILRNAQADLCHVQWMDDRVLDVSAAGGRPLVATAWGSDLNVPAQASPKSALRRRIGAALRELDLLIVDCDDIAETANQLAGTKVPTATLPIGIDTTLFQPNLPEERRRWREQWRIEPDAVVFLSARQLGAIYRPNEIIAAFAAMPASARERSYLIMREFGHGVGTSLPKLRRLVEELGIESRVRWVGSMAYEQQPGLYVSADLTVNFPQMDAFPVTILESLACGVAVLTNPLQAYQSNGVAPYLTFSREDSLLQLSATMAEALDNLPALRSQAARGREHIVQHFDERVSAVRLKEIYDALLLRLRHEAA
ncbi:glycosyltransferase [Steroidobacter sp.]|uniref:glycosyltransferase n=1 Tax=Steroidobacter sp. TaxID=1978227 RepID=UPI001A3BA05C|nr:glycosyltransferase [Steroidobacter sp.]MBL8264827.1 glycosyltransferase [Steroidobacter sp.]